VVLGDFSAPTASHPDGQFAYLDGRFAYLDSRLADLDSRSRADRPS